MVRIIPAILTADKIDLQNKIDQLAGFTGWVQLDIMDGKFVAEQSLMPEDIVSVHWPQGLKLELHLMVQDPLAYLAFSWPKSVSRIYFHLESLKNPAAVAAVLEKINSLGLEKGIAISPETPVENLKPYLSQIDAVLFLSVVPGKQGQDFIPETLEKIRRFKKLSAKTKIAVDGGINRDNIMQIAAAGADYLTIGSAIVKSSDPGQTLVELNQKLAVFNR